MTKPDVLMPLDGAAPAPSSIYLNADLNLRLTVFNSVVGVTLTLTTLLWDPEHGLQKSVETITPTTARLVNTRTILMGNGWLLGVQIVASGAQPRRGQCFARVEVVLGNTAAAQSLVTILQGYVLDTSGLSYPGSPLEASTSGRGLILSFTGTTPIPGADLSESVPTNARWRLLALRAAFLASGAAANRIPVFQVDNSGFGYILTGSAVTVTAGQLADYVLMPGAPFFTFGTLRYHLPLPTEVMMPAGSRIRSVTAAIQAADQWDPVQLLVEEWIED